jgi:hypothetical protein
MTRKEKIDPIDMHCNSCKASKRVVTQEDAEAFRKEHWEHVGGSISPNTPFTAGIPLGGEQAIIDLIEQQYEAVEKSLVEKMGEDIFGTVQQEREAGIWRGGYSGDSPPPEGWDTHFKSVEYLKKQAQEQLDKAQSHKDHAEALLEAVRILGLED